MKKLIITAIAISIASVGSGGLLDALAYGLAATLAEGAVKASADDDNKAKRNNPNANVIDDNDYENAKPHNSEPEDKQVFIKTVGLSDCIEKYADLKYMEKKDHYSVNFQLPNGRTQVVNIGYWVSGRKGASDNDDAYFMWTYICGKAQQKNANNAKKKLLGDILQKEFSLDTSNWIGGIKHPEEILGALGDVSGQRLLIQKAHLPNLYHEYSKWPSIWANVEDELKKIAIYADKIEKELTGKDEF